ncbi:MAG: twin-arginine translocase TatA/TatE family subunit [Solirubrobacterales bacterium]|nr:twin-arginine translocase TatA/TatE family subunit [Solirubrobacterales bacterium]
MFTNILQPSHLLIVLIVALVLLGPRRLPEAGRALGQGLKEFRNSISGEHHEERDAPPSVRGHHPDDPRLGESAAMATQAPELTTPSSATPAPTNHTSV